MLHNEKEISKLKATQNAQILELAEKVIKIIIITAFQL